MVEWKFIFTGSEWFLSILYLLLVEYVNKEGKLHETFKYNEGLFILLNMSNNNQSS